MRSDAFENYHLVSGEGPLSDSGRKRPDQWPSIVDYVCAKTAGSLPGHRFLSQRERNYTGRIGVHYPSNQFDNCAERVCAFG